MKKHISTILLVAVFFVGLSVLLYPTVSNYVNSKHQSKLIEAYETKVSNMTEHDFSEIFADAEEYNRQLMDNTDAFYHPETIPGYNEILNITGNGIMGYLTIDKINIELPVYHSVDDGILQIAAGHLPGTSLPVGGESTHCVLSGHRGLPSAKLFSDLDKLEVGDTFRLTVLNRILIYEVDSIEIVLPTEVENLQIVPGEDRCTLVTCTPYGVNTHRLLVHGVRTDGESGKPYIYAANEGVRIDPLLVAPAVAAPMLVILLIVLLVHTGKSGKASKSKEGLKDEEKTE